jgi:autotransporter translocation and assembly factor TamB
MIRVLVMIAVTGFFVSLVTLSAAVAIGGPQVLEEAAWRGWSPHWSHHGDYEGWGWDRRAGGAETTRQLDWTGGDTLDVAVPADVEYTQGPETKLTVSGPQRAVEDLEIDGGRLTFRGGRHHHRHFGDLKIILTAPGVTHFGMSGSGDLTIANYKQDKIDVRVSGNGDVTAHGDVTDLTLEVSGSGDADLGGLKARTADIEMSGSGDAKAAPTDAAKVRISGSGDVTLLTHPPRLETNVSGSGDLHTAAATTEPAKPAPPAPPAKPTPARKGKAT